MAVLDSRKCRQLCSRALATPTRLFLLLLSRLELLRIDVCCAVALLNQWIDQNNTLTKRLHFNMNECL